MLVLFQILLVLHVMGAMLWFGGAAFMPRWLREALASERPEARRRLASLMRQAKIVGAWGGLVVVLGIALMFVRPGGFGSLPVRYHVALLLGLIWLAVGPGALRSTLLRVSAIVAGEGPLEPAQRLVRRLSAFSGISHLLFVVLLVLMLWRL